MFIATVASASVVWASDATAWAWAYGSGFWLVAVVVLLGALVGCLWFSLRAKNLAKRLAASESRFSGLMDNLPQGVVMIDADMRIKAMNKAMRHWYPNVRSETAPLCFQSFNEPETPGPLWYCPTRRTLQDGQVHRAVVEKEIAGRKRLMRIVSCPVKNDRGEVVSVIELFDDITEYMESQVALEEQLHFTQSLLNAAPMPIHYRDREGRYLDCNNAYAELLGVPRKQIIGRAAEDFFPSEWAKESRKWEQRLLEQGGVFVEEMRLPLPGGEVRDVIVSKAPYTDVSDIPAGVVTVLTDISELKRVEQSLHEAEEKYRTIFENAMLGIFRATPEGDLLEVNPSLAALLGYEDQGELLRSPLARGLGFFAAPERGAEVLEALRQGQDMLRLESGFMREDGTVFSGGFSMRMARNEAGEPLFIDGMLEDVTERKQAEEELRRAKNEAEEASRLKSDFITAVSHELRTPLTSVLGFAKMLGKKLERDIFPLLGKGQGERTLSQVRANLRMLTIDAERLSYLINDVLDLSAMEAGRRELFLRSSSVPELMRRAVNGMRRDFEEAGVEVVMDLPPNLPTVLCDPDQIVEVIKELLENALKFSQGRRVVLNAGLSASDGYERVVVRVSDTGEGIAPQDQERIFELFTQLGDTLTDKPRGTGLGLPICRRIVALHGGELALESVPGQGSTFSFTLPRELFFAEGVEK